MKVNWIPCLTALQQYLLGTTVLVSVSLVVLLGSCTSDPPVPKPRTFPRMTFPERINNTVRLAECPFTFEFPTYGTIKTQSSFFGETPPHPCWFDIHISDFNADLYISYHEIEVRKDFEDLIRDTYKIAGKINQRSDYMEEIRIKNGAGIAGMKFLFDGAAASPLHFYMSDTTTHFVKGALYYNERVRPDSLQPATEFILNDIDHLLSTLRWN